MLKRLTLNASVVVLVSMLAMTVHSAEVKKIKPGDLRRTPQAVQTPETLQTPQKVGPGQVIQPKPDLTVTDIQISPANPRKNQRVYFSAKIVNKGLAPSAWCQGGIRLGGDPTPFIFSIPVLAPNAVHIVNRYEGMHSAGVFRVTFIADIVGSVDESKEDNNENYKDFQVRDVLPDLTVVDPQVSPANPTVNDQIHLTATLNNIGDIPSGPFQTGVRIGVESQPKPAVSVGHLDVTTPQSQQYVVSRLFNTTQPGTYVVEFFVDTQDDVQEHNENNNAIQFVITVGP